MDGTSTVTANTTVERRHVRLGRLWHGHHAHDQPGVTFTINSGTLDSDGDMDDPLTLAGDSSQLVVNNTNGLTQWTVTGTVTANASDAGTATIGGTSRMIVAGLMNVDGNTTISAPVTFNGAGLVADIDAGKILDVTSSSTTYADGAIDGVGTFDPGTSNTVTGDFTINADIFDFDGGSWTVQSGAELTFNTSDYEPDAVANAFDSTITLNNGGIFANSSDLSIRMNGTYEHERLRRPAPPNGTATRSTSATTAASSTPTLTSRATAIQTRRRGSLARCCSTPTPTSTSPRAARWSSTVR